MGRFSALALLCLCSCSHAPHEATDNLLPEPPREFRAAWVATVANIDWPSRPGLSTEVQKKEALAILDRLQSLHMNAVVFQVRPHGDALYASTLEPWSSYLTGEQGRAPEPAYDPLAFWIDEAHRRGIQLHAWLNPYRADHPSNKGGLHESHIARRQPEAVPVLQSKGYRWMDPSIPSVQDHTVAVVRDLVDRYDLDGIHFDDYFYPYPSYNNDQDFPDELSYARYLEAGGSLKRADWRRDHVNRLIQRLYGEIKARKPHVEFSISPFGIWRPGHPESIQGFDQHEVLYADARLWLREGWVDAFMPQLYWSIGKVPQSFPVLLGWWGEQNPHSRHLWPGTSIARLKGTEGATELVNQIMITRGMEPQSPGLCLFSMKWLMDNQSPLAAALANGPYKTPALSPASPWLLRQRPTAPRGTLRQERDHLVVRFEAGDAEDPYLWLVQVQRGTTWQHHLIPGGNREFLVPGKEEGITRLAVSAVDRTRVVGTPLHLR